MTSIINSKILIFGVLAIGVLYIQECNNKPKTKEVSTPVNSPYFHGVLSMQNISFQLSTSGLAPGQSSMQKLRIQPGGLSITNRELIHEIDGRVVDAEIADLNADGFPELLIYTQSAGSGSYGDVIAYSVNNGKSVSQVYFPHISDNPETSEGYMGHDEFIVTENFLTRRFPIYKEEDTNADPTGSKRQIAYKMVDGEASRRFEIVRITESDNH